MRKHEEGFTIVETVVTLVVTTLFVAMAMQLHYQVTSISVVQLQQSIASSLAYDNMRAYANGAAPNWFTCGDTSPGATTQIVKDETGLVDGLPGQVRQKVIASSPYGCSSSTTTNYLGMPIRVESTVSYAERSVTHVTYTAF